MGRPRKEETVDRPSTINRSERPERTPIHGYRDILGVIGQEEGWHYCWVNDYNVDRWLAGGYEFVTHEVRVGSKLINEGTQMGSKVSKPGGNGLTIFLMRCPEDIYQEELRRIDNDTAEREAMMLQNLNKKEDGQYGKVELKHGIGRVN